MATTLALAPAEVEVCYRADGSLVLHSPHALGPYPATLGERLRRWADIEGLLEKMQRYSTLYALAHVGKKSPSPLKALLSAGFAFFRNYILLGGIGRGYEGFLIAACNANGVLYKYLKLYEANKKCAAR